MNFHEANQRFRDFSRAASQPAYSANEPAMETACRLAHREAAPDVQARFPPGEDGRRITMKTMTGPLVVNNAEPVNACSAISGSPAASAPIEYPLACV
ncbi:hypothetical protein [Burkholderia sp. GS2Y]|uniref:Uncharacterized protein n=1 Tax=Burkholderia theae TaxID=3143496 RepID=A0ABU9WEQ0_9BURK